MLRSVRLSKEATLFVHKTVYPPYIATRPKSTRILCEPYQGEAAVRAMMATPVTTKYTIDRVCNNASIIRSGDN